MGIAIGALRLLLLRRKLLVSAIISIGRSAPSLRLTDQFSGWVVPTNTIRAVTETEGLLAEASFRPSRRTILQQRLRGINDDHSELAERLAHGEIAPQDRAIKRLSHREQAQVLELAKDYLAYRKASKPAAQARDEGVSLELLKSRSKLDIADQTLAIPPPKTRPDQGHKSARAGLALGYEEPSWFAQIELRPAYHDLMDREGGYIHGAQIQFLNVALRAYPEEERFGLERVDVIDVISLSPWNRFFHPISWKVNLGAVRKRFEGGSRLLVGRLNPGIGLSLDIDGRALVYAFAEGFLELGDPFEHFFATGIGPALGIIHDMSDHWRVGLSGHWQHLFLGKPTDTQLLTLAQRIDLTDQSALRLGLSWEHETGNSFFGARAAFHFYF
jgi:Protein chain release factor A